MPVYQPASPPLAVLLPLCLHLSGRDPHLRWTFRCCLVKKKPCNTRTPSVSNTTTDSAEDFARLKTIRNSAPHSHTIPVLVHRALWRGRGCWRVIPDALCVPLPQLYALQPPAARRKGWLQHLLPLQSLQHEEVLTTPVGYPWPHPVYRRH